MMNKTTAIDEYIEYWRKLKWKELDKLKIKRSEKIERSLPSEATVKTFEYIIQKEKSEVKEAIELSIIEFNKKYKKEIDPNFQVLFLNAFLGIFYKKLGLTDAPQSNIPERRREKVVPSKDKTAESRKGEEKVK